MEQSKKTMRHFYCRDVLWDTFEQMANDFDCSIDYLINEGMRYYARSKNYGNNLETGGVAARSLGPSGGVPTGVVGRKPPPPPGATGAEGGTETPRPGAASPGSGGSQRVRTAGVRPPAPSGGAVRPPTGSVRQPSGGVGARPAGGKLVLIFNNQQIPIEKDQFVIGRGSKSSDLAIKDGNISRKHAAVMLRNGTYYIKDLGSTNGVDYKGMRIDNKRIDDGDVFHICDYELKFIYQ